MNEVIGGVFLKVCKLTSVIHLCPSHHLCLETRYCSLKSLLLYPVHHPTWAQYNMLSIENENELSTNFCILLDKHWHFQVASRVAEEGARAGKEEKRWAALTFTSWANFIATTSAVVLCLAKWRNVSEEKPEYLLSTYK